MPGLIMVGRCRLVGYDWSGAGGAVVQWWLAKMRRGEGMVHGMHGRPWFESLKIETPRSFSGFVLRTSKRQVFLSVRPKDAVLFFVFKFSTQQPWTTP